MSYIIILIGEMGAGKNYWGERLSTELDIPFYDGDAVVTPEMNERVKKFKSLSSELIDDYVYNHLGPAMVEWAENGSAVIGQALYQNKHRLYLKRLLEEHGHVVRVWHIDTPFFQNLSQIYSRPNGFRWALYWLLSKPFFQKPNFPHEVL